MGIRQPHGSARVAAGRARGDVASTQETAGKVTGDGWLIDQLAGVAGAELAGRIEDLIHSGRMAPGYRLPTVRDMSKALSLSTGTIAAAWSRLQSAGMIETRRRGGTVVAARHDDPQADAPFPGGADSLTFDLAQGITDPAFQPDLGAALASGALNGNLTGPHKEFITVKLRAAVEPDWPFGPQAWTTAGGGAEGSVLAIEACAPPGTLVAIEHPTSPRLLDTLAQLGVRAIPVECDSSGPTPQSLEEALKQRPAAFIYQPRAQVPLGHSVPSHRVEELARVLADADAPTCVIEDDNNGPISISPVHSIGRFLPDRILHVRSFCKTFGVELRTSVIAGSKPLIDRVRALRSHGFGMTSRILQDAVAHLLTQEKSRSKLEVARQSYARRRRILSESLRAQGIHVQGEDGVLLWVEVPDEASAMLNLALSGITVGPGSRCYITPPETAHIRVATSRLPDDPAKIRGLARMIASAASGKQREEFD